MSEFGDRINIVQWSNSAEDDLLLAAGGQDGRVIIFNVTTKKVFCKLPAVESGGIKCMSFSPDNKMLATGGQDTLCIWQLNNDSQSQTPFKFYHKP